MQFLDPRNDVAFKKIFGSEEHKNITISFLNALLEYTGDKTITEVQFLNTEQHPFIIKEKKENSLDILCTDQRNHRYVVEMQIKQVKEFGNRMVYYGAKTYALQLGVGKPYHQLTPVIVIAIANFNILPAEEGYKSIHKIQSTKTSMCHLDQLTFVFAELKKFHKKEHELVSVEDKWLYFIKEISNQREIPQPLSQKEFKEACFAAERMKWSEAELNAYDDAFVRSTDDQTSIELAEEKGIAKGLVKGLEKGREEGREEGLEEGREEGREEGLEEGRKNTAINMLKKNCDIVLIAEVTGLSIEEISTLKNLPNNLT